MNTIEFKKNMVIIKPILKKALENKENNEVTILNQRLSRDVVQNMYDTFEAAVKDDSIDVSKDIIPTKLLARSRDFRRLFASLR